MASRIAIRCVAVATAALLLLAGCASKTEPPAGLAGANAKPAPAPVAQNVVVAMAADVVQFDPLDIGDSPSSTVAGAVMEGLVRRDKDGLMVPALAEKWTASPDGLTWTFDLRKGVKFHDGSAFDASVVKWHFDRILSDPNAPTRFRKQWGDVIKEVTAPDPAKIVVSLKAPNAAFLDLVIITNAGFIPSKANFEKLGAKEAAVKPVGTGPFKFKEWVTGQKVVLEGNPDYWGTKTKLQTLTFRPIAESNTQVIELETGGVHLISKLTQEDVTRLKQNKQVAVESVPAYRTRYVSFNPSNGPLSDLKVRQALVMALDIKAIVTSLVGDMGSVSKSSILPLDSWGHPKDLGLPKFDVAGAKKLLDEAGWKPGANGKLAKDGKPLKIQLLSPNGRYFMDKEICEAIKNQWGQVGVEVDLQVMEWAPFLAQVQKGDFQAAFLGWNQSSPDPSVHLDPQVKTGGRSNNAKTSDKDLDQYLGQAVVTSDQAKRAELYGKAAKLVEERAWFVPLYNETKVAARTTQLAGYIHSAAADQYAGLYLEAKGN